MRPSPKRHTLMSALMPQLTTLFLSTQETIGSDLTVIGHFLVSRLLSGSEAEVDLVMIQSLELFR